MLIVTMIKEMNHFFEPKTIAVVGASSKKTSVGGTIFENLLKQKNKHRAKIIPINNKRKKIQGIKAYKSLLDVKEKIELAIIIVPAKYVSSIIEECEIKKIKTAIIISAGFKETGNLELEKKLNDAIQKTETKILGPNCFGIYNGHNQLNTTFSGKEQMELPKNGNIAFISQSGALGLTILDSLANKTTGISKFISYGNANDIDETDLIQYLQKDKKTKVITMYLEGIKDGQKFLKNAKETTKQKPIILLKGGTTKESKQATTSHTGTLAGNQKVYESAMKQAGIIQAKNLEELYQIAKIFSIEKENKGKNVTIITNGGGFGILTTDEIINNELKLTNYNKKTKIELRKKLPKKIAINNPLDLIGDATPEEYEIALEEIIKDKNTNIIIVIVLFSLPGINKKIIQTLIKIKQKIEKTNKTMIVVSTGSNYTKKMITQLEEKNICTYEYPNQAIKAASEFAKYYTDTK